MQTQLTVIKSDGGTEGYIHTKVIGTIIKALEGAGQTDVYLAEQLAEAVTYYLYHQRIGRSVTSGEILSIIKAALTSTGYDDAAVVLSEYHIKRRLKRSRTDVVSLDVQVLADSAALGGSEKAENRESWDKSRIVDDLVTKRALERQTARAVASMVENTVFNMGISSVPSGLVKQLVLNQTAIVLRAERQLQTA